MSAKVYTLGESLLDIIFEQDQPCRSIPGGSLLNTTVSLGRQGLETELITEFFPDEPGRMIRDFLAKNHVGSNWGIQHEGHKTPLAIASLDKQKKAHYTFYQDYPETISNFRIPEFRAGDLLIFGSAFALKPNRRSLLKPLCENAAESGALLIYDPNIRKGCSSTHTLELFLENASYTHILKGSDEDFTQLFGTTDHGVIYAEVRKHCQVLIITSGNKPVTLCLPGSTSSYPVPELQPVSTIGAGDTFTAGIACAIISLGLNQGNIVSLPLTEWDFIIQSGIQFSAACCLSSGNYIPEDFEWIIKS